MNAPARNTASLLSHAFALLAPSQLSSDQRGTPFADQPAHRGTFMNVSAVCEKCGDIADAELGEFRHNLDTTVTHGSSLRQMVTIHCRSCGTYERAPHCQVDRVDTAMLRFLVL